MTTTSAVVLVVVAGLPVCAVVGHFMGRRMGSHMAKSLYTPALYPCVRCDEPDKVRGMMDRCEPCEAVVTDIIFEAASRGVIVKDPLMDIRRQLRSKGL
jgi:hypothetical protein